MRASPVALAILLASASAAAAPCHWAPDDGWDPLVFRGRSVFLRRSYVCPGPARGTLAVELRAGHGKKVVSVKTDSRDITPYARWDRTFYLSENVAPSQYCKVADPADKNARLMRAANRVDLVTMVPVTVQAVIIGSGDLKPLSGSLDVQAWCTACDHYRSWETSLRIKKGRSGVSRVEAGVRLVGEVEKEWFSCARPLSTLQIRYFVAADRKAAEAALRPNLVQDGLEKKFRPDPRHEGKLLLDEALPLKQLCRVPGAAVVAWEADGAGELQRISGGGRTVLGLKCR